MKLNYKMWIGTLLLAGTLFAAAPPAFSQVSIGIQIGAPPAPRVLAVRPPCPGPEDEYAWIEGYWYPVEGSLFLAPRLLDASAVCWRGLGRSIL
jgi:hypothetical protein